ncbi:hypothetical protein [Paraburkholderia graminis]
MFCKQPASLEHHPDTRLSPFIVGPPGREMGIEMSAHLAPTEAFSEGSALNFPVVTYALMKRGPRPSADGSLEDACATGRGVEVPPISNLILVIVAHELLGPWTPLRMASTDPQRARAARSIE